MIPPREPQEGTSMSDLRDTPIGDLAALRGELARLTEQVATLTTWHEADQADIGRLEKELRLNAKMLARQCDLARDAENAFSAQQAQIRALVEQWRKEAGRLAKHGWLQSIRRNAIEKCADQLAAFLIPETPVHDKGRTP